MSTWPRFRGSPACWETFATAIAYLADANPTGHVALAALVEQVELEYNRESPDADRLAEAAAAVYALAPSRPSLTTAEIILAARLVHSDDRKRIAAALLRYVETDTLLSELSLNRGVEVAS